MLRKVLLVTSLLSAAIPVLCAKERILLHRIGPSESTLFIAKKDGSDERPLLPNSDFDYNPSFSADGKWVVFTSERGGSADIYRVHPDGSGLERLTDDPAYDDQGALSPDGKQLAFVSSRGAGSADIWVLDLLTKKVRNLTHAPANFRPSWSPDGKWIAFSSDRNTPVRRLDADRFAQVDAVSIYVMRADGTDVRRPTIRANLQARRSGLRMVKESFSMSWRSQIRITPCDRDWESQSIRRSSPSMSRPAVVSSTHQVRG